LKKRSKKRLLLKRDGWLCAYPELPKFFGSFFQKRTACLPLVLALLAGNAQAAEPALQDATITGHGGTITISRLPVHTSHGTIYRDVTIELSVDEAGNVHFATGAAGAPGGPAGQGPMVQPALVQAPSVPPTTQHFRPGTFESADGALMQLRLRTASDGSQSWHFSTIRAGGSPIEEASWQEGAIADNPHAAIIRRAGIVSQAYSYGESEGGSDAFTDGALLGATESGDTLTIVSFRHGCCTNTPKPSASWTLSWAGR
jgi:hypothetical protein